MRLWDRAALAAACFAGLFLYYRSWTGRTALSAAAALVSLLLLVRAARRWKNRPKFVYRREKKAAYSEAKRALRALSLRGEEEAVGTVGAILADRFALTEVSLRADGFLCREEGRALWVAVLARHPEAGCVAPADLARAARRQREEGAAACALCALCAAGKPPADEALRAVRVLDAEALARLWADSGVPIPKTEEAPRQRARFLRALASPLSPGERRRCLGYGALLLLSGAVSRSPALIACALAQLARVGLSLAKKRPARLCG